MVIMRKTGLAHEPGLANELKELPGVFYVGVPPQSPVSAEYGGYIRTFPSTAPLDDATIIMSDYSRPTAHHGAIFDQLEAISMANLSANFPANLEDPAAYGYPYPMPRRSRATTRSAYRPPGNPAVADS